jgi:hypothetical protein
MRCGKVISFQFVYTRMQEPFLREEKRGVEVQPQTTQMLFCPVSGKRNPVPESATAWRQQHQVVWLFDPWTGVQRERLEIERDPYGRLLVPPSEELPFEWLPGFVKTGGVYLAAGQLEKAGWTVKGMARTLWRRCPGVRWPSPSG